MFSFLLAALTVLSALTVLPITAAADTHEHTFEEDYSFNETHHWHASTCGHDLVSGFGTHDCDAVTSGNATTYTCKRCGYTKVVYDKTGDSEGELVGGATFTGISLTLGSDISINFYMDLTEEARQNGRLTFDIGGRTVTADGTDAKYNAAVGKYYFRTPLTVLEMAETVTATFTCHGVDSVQEYSVAEYIDELVGNPDRYGEKAVALAKKIANYGYYAQLYLASIHESVEIGGDGYAAMEKFGGADIDVGAAKEALADYTVRVSGTSDDLTPYGSTVSFESATALNYYVTAKDGITPSATAVNTVTGETKEVGIRLSGGNVWVVSVRDITATELSDDVAVTINGEITLTGSVLAYCNAVVKAHSGEIVTDKDVAATNAMAAFCEYGQAALEYTSYELTFIEPARYRILTADGGEEITEETTLKCYRPFRFRVVPDENYRITGVYSEGDLEPDENGLYTVSFTGGNHDVIVSAAPVTVDLAVIVSGEGEGKPTNTRVSFEYDGNTVTGSAYAPGQYQISIPKGAQGTVVVIKDGYEEYREAFTADGTVDEITVVLTPSEG